MIHLMDLLMCTSACGINKQYQRKDSAIDFITDLIKLLAQVPNGQSQLAHVTVNKLVQLMTESTTVLDKNCLFSRFFNIGTADGKS